MEVHHPHHPTHKKKWLEYLLEFWMLFLAVSLGFVAENVREHYIEKERAHELLGSVMNDVKSNIKLIDSLVAGNNAIMLKNDSALLYIETNDKISLDSFFNFLPVVSYRYLNNNDTYDQMKSSGSLRYIKDSVLLRNIIEYSKLSKSAEYRSVNYEAEYIANEYTSIMQKWVPEDISLKRQTSLFLKRPEYNAIFYKGENLPVMNALNNYASQKRLFLSGEKLMLMRKELVNAITRKVTLVSGSTLFMLRTKAQAIRLLDYYQNILE